MRNLTFLTNEAHEVSARAFREAFMEKTATWNVAIARCSTTEEAQQILNNKSHAYVTIPAFRSVLYEAGYVKGASARLTQGADVLYRGGSNMIALSQCARSVVDTLEEQFIPIYGARVVIVGSSGAAFDVAYECSRAGVDEVILLDADKDRVRNNLEAFLDAFGKTRMQILDTEQARVGHLSAVRAYEHTEFLYGSLTGARARVKHADIIIGMLPSAQTKRYEKDLMAWPLHSSQIICGLWADSDMPLLRRAQEQACDMVSMNDVMGTWGSAAADLLIEFGNASL